MVGILLRAGILKDEVFYAVLIGVIINGTMFFGVCGREGPVVRSTLHRFIAAYKRRRLGAPGDRANDGRG